MSYFGIPIRNGIGIGLRSYVGLESKAPAWTPAKIATALWLDAADARTITLNGNAVSQWNDKSGNGRNATQATAASQPIYSSIGYNNKPGLSFDGVNDFLNMTDGSVPTGDTNYSIFVMVRVNVIANNLIIGRGVVSGAGQGAACYLGYFATNVMGNWWQGTGMAIETVLSAPAQAMYAATYNNVTTTMSGYKDGSLQFTFVPPFRRASLATGQAIGGNPVSNDNYLNGTVAEIIIIQDIISTTNRQLIEGYLAWKWGTASSLPSDHPYKNAPPYA